MKKYFFALTILTVIITSCKKEAIDKTASLQNLGNGANRTATAAIQSTTNPTFTVVDNGDGTFTATLQPDSSNGQDVHVYKRQGDASIANTNFNTVPELNISAWTVNGSPAYLRVLLRFDDLANIPSNAHVLSATLYLYGLSSSIVSPQGNSTYPHSPYNSYGTNHSIIEPVTGPWDESTVTWNTQPKANNKFQVSVPPSNSQWNYDVALTDVKAMVSQAVKYPAKNYGVRISLADETYYRNLIFASSESADPTKRPKLVVTYSN